MTPIANGAFVLMLCATAIGLADRAVAATVEIGAVREIHAASPPSPITGGGFTVQAGEATGSYAVPAGYGTITSWRHSAGTAGGSLTLKVYRPTGVSKQYVAVASDTRAVTASATQSFDVQIAVQPGDRLGLSSDDVQLAFESSDPGDRIGFFGSDPPGAATRSTDGEPFPGYRLDVAATLDSGASAGGDPPPGGSVPGGGSPGGRSRLPVVSKLVLAPVAFAARRTGPSVPASGGGGTKVGFRIDGAADVRFRVQRLRLGRRRGGGASPRCVAATPRNRAAATCTRRIPLAGGFVRKAKAGANSFRFSGRLGGRRLSPGSYRLVATPIVHGTTGAAVARIFRIRR